MHRGTDSEHTRRKGRSLPGRISGQDPKCADSAYHVECNSSKRAEFGLNGHLLEYENEIKRRKASCRWATCDLSPVKPPVGVIDSRPCLNNYRLKASSGRDNQPIETPKSSMVIESLKASPQGMKAGDSPRLDRPTSRGPVIPRHPRVG